MSVQETLEVPMVMTPKTYFRSALAVPFAVPILFSFLGWNLLTGILVLSLFFGGLPYLFFASGLFILIGRLQSTASLKVLTWLAPLLFVPVQAAFWVIPVSAGMLQGADAGGGWTILLLFALYSLGIGYLYVVLVQFMYAVLCRSGKIVPSAV